MHQTFDVIVRDQGNERTIYSTGWDTTSTHPNDTQRHAHDRALGVACEYAAKHRTVNPIIRLVTHGGSWNVRSVCGTATRDRWHKVKEFNLGKFAHTAITVCGLVYDFPTPSVVFSETLGECTYNNLCKGCYNGN